MSVHKHYMAKVLIAEDNRVEAALIENMLEEFGCEVFKARTAPVELASLSLYPLEIATIGGEIHIQARHLVKADDNIHRVRRQFGAQACEESLVAGVAL